MQGQDAMATPRADEINAVSGGNAEVDTGRQADSAAFLGSYPAYVWESGTLRAVERLVAQPVAAFVGIDAQRQALLDNTSRLAAGHAAHDVLLWGARGMGKSGLVKAAVAHLQASGAALAIVEVERDDIARLTPLLRRLAGSGRPFVLFCDDLSFDADERHYRRLRSVLDGGVEPRPANCRFYVTSNRRQLVARDIHDNELQNAVNVRDVLDDRLALADRFGLSLGFHHCDQTTYLAIVETYAVRHGLPFHPADALAWATGRGARSGRVAWQYAQELAGREGKSL
jgi:hypothetical protein